MEVADGRHPGALKVLAIMQDLQDRFGSGTSGTVGGDAPGLRQAGAAGPTEYEKARLELAEWAAAKRNCRSRRSASTARWWPTAVAPSSRTPRADWSSSSGPSRRRSPRTLAEAVVINDRRYARDDFLSLCPAIGSLHEAESADLRVRTPRGAQEADPLLAALTALVPSLEKDAGGRPTRLLEVFVFGARADFEAWLTAAGLPEHKVGAGMADGGRGVALVCAEGLDDDAVLGATSRGRPPVPVPGDPGGDALLVRARASPRTWGGRGTFTWDGRPSRRAAPSPRTGASRSSATASSRSQTSSTARRSACSPRIRNRAHRFYAESWAFVRFLRSGADADTRERFRRWERLCKGAAVGRRPGSPTRGTPVPRRPSSGRPWRPTSPAWSRPSGSGSGPCRAEARQRGGGSPRTASISPTVGNFTRGRPSGAPRATSAASIRSHSAKVTARIPRAARSAGSRPGLRRLWCK